MKKPQLSSSVEGFLNEYFEIHKREVCEPQNVYDSIMNEIEKTVIDTALRYSDHNQTKASDILGINRNTLRRKMRDYGLMKKGKCR